MEHINVLVVDDSETVHQDVQRILADEEIDLRFASNAMEALEAILTKKPQVILLDGHLGAGMSGSDLLPRLPKDTTVIWISSNDNSDPRINFRAEKGRWFKESLKEAMAQALKLCTKQD